MQEKGAPQTVRELLQRNFRDAKCQNSSAILWYIGEQKNTKVRNDRLDAVKFWLIVLVISAHVLMRKEFADSPSCAVVWNWLCIFDMPLFVFISGYYSRKKESKDFRSSILKLLEPLIVFHVIALVFYVKHPLSIRSILSPWYILWYLLSLIYWRCMLQMIPDKMLRHKKTILIVTFCISILSGFLPFDRILSLQRTLALMPFFFLGYFMKGRNVFLPDKYKLLCIGFLLVILAILFLHPHRNNYLLYATPYKSIYGAAIRVTAFAVAIPMAMAFMNACYTAPWIARQGRMTMQYYIYHALIIPPMSAPIIPPLIAIAATLNIPMTFATATGITMVTTFLIAVVLKIPYIKMLTNPSLLLRQKTQI